MGFSVRTEEYAPLGDFLMASFVRDQSAIAVLFPKLNAVYVTAFQDKLVVVKKLESTLKLTEAEKKATVQLYAEAEAVNTELNVLSAYFDDAGLPTEAISGLKKNLTKGNIEGALLQMKDVQQFAEANQAALEAEGMDSGYPAELEGHQVSMAEKNGLQNSFLNARKTLVDANKGDYKALYAYISNVAKKGKLIFDGTVVAHEYNITKIVSKMRAPKKGVTP
jgi:hypothetical protein